MASTRIVPLGSADAPIAAYHSAGGVVEYVLVDALGEPDPHRVTLAMASLEIERRYNLIREEAQDIALPTTSARYTLDSHPDRAVPSLVSVADFVGRGYDFDHQRIDDLWSGGSRVAQTSSPYVTTGYAEAFSSPPYSMQADLEQITAWFNAINDELLGGLTDGLEIVSWSTDWSSWFDAGHEWWGSFFWTVRPVDRPWMVAIAASTTD